MGSQSKPVFTRITNKLREWFTLDNILKTIFAAIIGWAVFLKMEGWFGASVLIAGACIGAVLLIRSITKNKTIRLRVSVILSFMVVLILVLVGRFTPLWEALVSYSTAATPNPYEQNIRTAVGTAEIYVSSNEQPNEKFFTAKGYIAFGKEGKSILAVGVSNCTGAWNGNNTRIYYAGFDLALIQLWAQKDFTARKVNELKLAEFVQMELSPIPNGSFIQKGTAVVTINDKVKVTLTIPQQTMDGQYIIVHDVQKFLAFEE